MISRIRLSPLRACTAAVFVAALTAPAATAVAGEELSISLEAFEARRIDGPGADRRAESVRIGIPFTNAMGVREVHGRPALGLKGADNYQYRTLARWPDGNVRWAAVTFQTDCKAKQKAAGFTVGPGAGVSNGTPLASETDTTITVDTGSLVVSIRKQRFNLFDGVKVGGTTIVAPGAMDAVVTDTKGSVYTGSADGTAIIEQNGPVCCVIKAAGSNRSENGTRMLGYLVRMYFYRGHSDVRVYYTCTNDEDKENRTKVEVKSIRLVTPLAQSPATVRVPGLDAGEPLEPSKDIVFYQARPKRDTHHGNGKESMRPEAFGAKANDKGYWIKKGATELLRGTAEESPDLMWMDAAGAGGAGVTVGIRFARGNYPKTLRASAGGTVSVDLWPEESGVTHVIAHGSHNTFEVLYDFHAKAVAGPSQTMYRFQYPLVGRCPVAWYNRCTGDTEIYPLYHFVSRGEEDALAREKKWKYPRANRLRDMVVFRSWYWGDGGFRNQHDFARVSFVNFLRDENLDRAGAYFLYAEDRINYNCDWSIHHGKGRTDLGRQGPVGIKINFEEEHVHWYGIPLFYYGTGDQRIGDAGEEFVRKFRQDRSTDRMYGWIRFLGWGMYFLAAGNDMTGEEPFREGLRFHARNVVQNKARWSRKPTKRRPEWPTWNMDWHRGAFAHGGVRWDKIPPEPAKTWKPGLMQGYIIHDAFWLARSRFDWDDPCGDRLNDICEGIEWLIARECFMEDEKGFFLPYVYNLSGEPKVHRRGSGLIGEAHYSVLLPILTNGEQYAKNLAERVVKTSFSSTMNEHGFTHLDHPGCQALLYYLLHQKKRYDIGTAPEPIADLQMEPLGEGKVTLSWTTPVGAERFQVRYSSRPMVPYLEFQRDKRQYAFDPDEHTNWWAAEHVHGEPAAEPGTKQRFTADLTAGLKIDGTPFTPGDCYFAIRSWGARNHRSPISNQVKITVR